MIPRFCTKCNAVACYDRHFDHYGCECFAVLPVPDEDWPLGGHSPEFIPDHWIDTESDTVGSELIVRERERQINEEGWTPEHDDEYTEGELARAAAFYAMPEKYGLPWGTWPWSPEWNKKLDHNRIKQLKIAGALIAAEIDRLIRLEIKGE